MKDRVAKNSLLKIVSMFVLMIIGMSFFVGCSLGKTDSTYAISGIIVDDETNAPVENVLISSEMGDVYTDKDGKYTINGINGAILVKPSKDGYHFEMQSKKVTGKGDDANFVASKEYELSGIVKNNYVGVPNAKVKISSLAGEFETTSDENGKFKMAGVAGVAKVSCLVDDVEFFNSTATILDPYVTITSLTNCHINFSFDDGNVNPSKISIKKTFGTETETFVDGELLEFPNVLFTDVKCGTVFEISSDYYDINNKRIVIDSLNQTVDVSALRFYQVSGYVKSGSQNIEGAGLYISGTKLAMTDNNGWFQISGLTENQKLDAVYGNLKFASKDINLNVSTATFNGTKDIILSFNFDHYVEGDIQFSHQSQIVDGTYNKYNLKGVELGQNITLSCDKYNFSKSSLTVSESDQYLIDCFALFDGAVNVAGDFEYSLLLDGNEIQENALENLYGSHEISASYSNYVFETKLLSYENQSITLGYQIPYDVYVSIVSGGISLIDDSQMKLNGNVVSISEDLDSQNSNLVLLQSLVGQNTIEIEADGYNKLTKVVNEEMSGTTLVLNLTYDIFGVVKTGSVAVSEALVSNGTMSVSTDDSGNFAFRNLSGANEISITKEFFNFSDSGFVVNHQTSGIEVNGTYSISGSVVADSNVTDLSTCVVTLTHYDSALADYVKETTSIENGAFRFEGLSGKYTLCVFDKNDELPLNPKSWSVLGGGDSYNFNFRGFSVSGRVTSGGVPISGVKLVAGEDNAPCYTNENGEYTFELIVDPCTIVASKEGYNFGEGQYVSGETGTTITQNFEGTYSISGRVVSGTLGISGVQVSISNLVVATTDSQGYFNIQSVSGNVVLTFAKTGAVFSGTTSISQYSNITVECSLIKTINVVSGNIEITNFAYYLNGSKIGVSENSSIDVTVKIGDVLTFEKQGYVFEEITIGAENSYTSNVTYSIMGTVKSGSRDLEGAIVKYGDNSVQTKRASNGSVGFILTGIVGSIELKIEMQGYNGTSYVVSGYDNALNFNLSYFVTGKVTIGKSNVALENVSVKAKFNNGTSDEESTVLTQNDGTFNVEVYGEYSLELSKDGYGFESITNQFELKNQLISASFSVSGFVKTGDVAISGKAIVALTEKGVTYTRYATTAKDGSFSFSGIVDVCSVKICDDGYESLEISGINNLKTDANFDVGYFVTLSFDVETIIKYSVDGSQKSVKTDLVGGSYVARLTLHGKVKLSFESVASGSDGHISYNPSSKTYSAPKSETIQSEVTYQISGSVTVEGVAISGVELKEGSRVFATTGTDGKYRDENGNEVISVPKNTEITLNYYGKTFDNDKKTIKNDGSVNFALSVDTFGEKIFRIAEEKLTNKNQALQMFSRKDVNRSDARPENNTDSWVYGVPAISSPTTQYVYSVFRRDSNGNTIKQNLNAGSTVLGVDPNLSLVVTNINGVIKYQDIRGSSNITNEYTANHGNYNDFSVTSADYIESTYGSLPTSCLPYNLNNLSNYSEFRLDGDGYVFTFNLSNAQNGYKTQIAKLAPSGTSFKEFYSSKFTVKISRDGYLQSIVADDSYKINKAVDVTVTSKIIYDFYYNDIYSLSNVNDSSSINDWLTKDYRP